MSERMGDSTMKVYILTEDLNPRKDPKKDRFRIHGVYTRYTDAFLKQARILKGRYDYYGESQAKPYRILQFSVRGK